MGKFYLLCLSLLTGTVYAQSFHCLYHPKPSFTDPEPELTRYDNCGTLSGDNTLQFTQYHLDNISYGGPHQLACIHVFTGKSLNTWYYRNSGGAIIETVGLDNGCDYFVHGVARSIVNGKTRFFDPQLNIVLETPYLNASPFYDGLASVCYGGNTVRDGEHRFLENATCAYITTSGDLATDFMPQNMLPSRSELGIPCEDLCN